MDLIQINGILRVRNVQVNAPGKTRAGKDTRRERHAPGKTAYIYKLPDRTLHEDQRCPSVTPEHQVECLADVK
jgi:hypothetical protein